MAGWMRLCLFSFAPTSWRKKSGLQSEISQVQIWTELIFDIKVLSWWWRNENEEKKKISMTIAFSS